MAWFMAQGTKCVLDTLGHFKRHRLLATHQWAQEHPDTDAEIVKPDDIASIATLSTPPAVIAIYEIPDRGTEAAIPSSGLYLALDCVQDPGNLGTIIRVCDWMGVHKIFASADTADVWNPKVVQATMGAISRVEIEYCDLAAVLAKSELPVFGTFLNEESIYKCQLPTDAVIVMGNEGNGISDAIGALATHRITIPSYPAGAPTSESLNVAIATAITLSEFRRNG